MLWANAVIMANLEQSDIFGEALLFSKQPLWPATIKATKVSKIMFIPLETFIDTLPDCQQCQTKTCPTYWRTCLKKLFSLQERFIILP